MITINSTPLHTWIKANYFVVNKFTSCHSARINKVNCSSKRNEINIMGNYFVVGMPLEVNGACRQKSDTDCSCSGCSHASIQYGVPKLGQLNSGKNGDTICSSIELIYLLQGCFNHKLRLRPTRI